MDYSFSEVKCAKCSKYFSNKAAFNAHKVRCAKPPSTSPQASDLTTSSPSISDSLTSNPSASSPSTPSPLSSSPPPSHPLIGEPDSEDIADENLAKESLSVVVDEKIKAAKEEIKAEDDAASITGKADSSSNESPEKTGNGVVKEEPPSDPSVDDGTVIKTERKCAVHNCNIIEGTINEEGRLIEFFNFPKGLRLLAKWTRVARPMSPEYVPREGEVMCEKHFREGDLRMQKLGLIRRADPVTGEEMEEEKKDREAETPARVNVEMIVKDVIRFDGQYPYCEPSTSSKVPSNGDLLQIPQPQPEGKVVKKELDETEERVVKQEEPVAGDEVNERVINILGAVEQNQVRTARTLNCACRDLYGLQAKQCGMTSLMKGLSKLSNGNAVGRGLYITGNAERRKSKSVKKLNVIVKRRKTGKNVQPSSVRRINTVASSWMRLKNAKPLTHKASSLRQHMQLQPAQEAHSCYPRMNKASKSEPFEPMPKLERSDIAVASTPFSEHSYGCSTSGKSRGSVSKAGCSKMASNDLKRDVAPDLNASKSGQSEQSAGIVNGALGYFQIRRPIVGGTANFTSVKRLKMIETRQGSMEFEVEPNRGNWVPDDNSFDGLEAIRIRKASPPRRSNINILSLKKQKNASLLEHVFENGKKISGASTSNSLATAQKVFSNFVFINKTRHPVPCLASGRHIVEHSYGSVKQKKQHASAETTSSSGASSSCSDTASKKGRKPDTAADFGRRAFAADLDESGTEVNFGDTPNQSLRRDMDLIGIDKPGNFRKENILPPYGKSGIGSLTRAHRGTSQTKRGYYRGEGDPRVRNDTLLHPEEDRKMGKEEICYHVQRAILLLDDTCFTKLKLRRDGPLWLTGVSDTAIDNAIDELKGTGFLYPDTEAEDDDETYLFADPLELEDYQVWLAFYRVTEFEYLRHFREEIVN